MRPVSPAMVARDGSKRERRIRKVVFPESNTTVRSVVGAPAVRASCLRRACGPYRVAARPHHIPAPCRRAGRSRTPWSRAAQTIRPIGRLGRRRLDLRQDRFHPSRGTAMGGRQTSTPRPKGSGRTIRSQLRITRRRTRVWAAHGSTDAPAIEATFATPRAATRRGPRGPSGVMSTCSPRASSGSAASTPAAPPRVEDP